MRRVARAVTVLLLLALGLQSFLGQPDNDPRGPGVALAGVDVGSPVLGAAAEQPPAHTLYLRGADTVVEGVAYNSLDAVPGDAPEDISAWTGSTGYRLFADASPRSIFVSGPVPAGTVRTLGGVWTFNMYVRASSGSNTGYMVARVFRISASGAAAAVYTTVAGADDALHTMTPTLRSWTDTIPDTALAAGERFGVELMAKVTDVSNRAASAFLGIDGANGSNSDSSIDAAYTDAALPPGPGMVKQSAYRVGNDDPLAAMTWQGGLNQRATNLRRGTRYRVRFQVYNDGPSASSWRPQLEWSATSGSGYVQVPVTSGAAPFFIADTSHLTDGDSIATADFGLGAGQGTPAAGTAYDASNHPPSDITLETASYTEIEFSIQPNDHAAYGAWYYFRLTNAGIALDAYGIPEAVVRIQPAPGAGDPHGVFIATTDKCALCHRTHAAQGRELRIGGISEQSLCYSCHDGTGARTDIQSQMEKTVAGAPDPAQAGKHPVALREWAHQTGETLPAQFSGASRHVECEDCHKPHSSSPGLHDSGNNSASPAIASSSGVRAANTAPWTSPAYAFIQNIAYEYEVCLKCHSSWAYGASPPDAPSGFWNASGAIVAAAQTDQAVEFNTLNYSHHAVEGPGENQPPISANPNWPDNGLGLSNTFAAPLTATSTVQCVDCHSGDTSAEPQGPHGSSRRWMVRQYEGPEPVSSTEIFCYNCHRRDVYGDINDTEPDNATLKHAWSRFPHRLYLASREVHRSNDLNRWGIWCMSCHAGDVLGGVHGTNRAAGILGATDIGKRMLNGAATAGWTAGTTSFGSGGWFGKEAEDEVNLCTCHGAGVAWTANYNYMP